MKPSLLKLQAAAWRAEPAEPWAVAAMDQRVAARCADLKEGGATIYTGHTAGAGALLAVQAIYCRVAFDPRTDHDSPAFTALTDAVVAEAVLASRMMGDLEAVHLVNRPRCEPGGDQAVASTAL